MNFLCHISSLNDFGMQQLQYTGDKAKVEFEWYIPETQVELEQSPLNMLCSGDFRTRPDWFVYI